MAKRATVSLSDDLDGSEGPGVRTVMFGWQGTEYEIDLNESHREDFALAIGRYLHAARHARPGHPRTRTEAQRQRTRDIRRWAVAQGEQLQDRGRIPSRVIQRYWEAHKETGTEQ